MVEPGGSVLKGDGCVDRHRNHSTRLQAPVIPLSVVGRPALNLEECRSLEGPGIHVDVPLGESESRGRNSQLVGDQGDVGTNVDGTAQLLVISNANPMEDHEEHQV